MDRLQLSRWHLSLIFLPALLYTWPGWKNAYPLIASPIFLRHINFFLYEACHLSSSSSILLPCPTINECHSQYAELLECSKFCKLAWLCFCILAWSWSYTLACLWSCSLTCSWSCTLACSLVILHTWLLMILHTLTLIRMHAIMLRILHVNMPMILHSNLFMILFVHMDQLSSFPA